jgi:hypothetical protein
MFAAGFGDDKTGLIFIYSPFNKFMAASTPPF